MSLLPRFGGSDVLEWLDTYIQDAAEYRRRRLTPWGRAESRGRIDGLQSARALISRHLELVGAGAEPRPWKGANPGYGISPTRAFMETASTEAKQSPSDSPEPTDFRVSLPCVECGRPVDVGDCRYYSANHFRHAAEVGVLHNECGENRARWLAEQDDFMDRARS